MAPGSTLNTAAEPGSIVNQPYAVSFAGTNVSGTDTFSVANNGTGTGALALGNLNDSGAAATIETLSAGYRKA